MSLHDPPPNPLRTLRDDMHRRESQAADQADQRTRRQQLTERLTNGLKQLISCARGLLSPVECPRESAFFADLASALLGFNQTLKLADQEYPRYRMFERLGRAASIGVPALDTAASLLLTDPASDVDVLARDLEHIRQTHPYDSWPLWLTYILDQLLNSHQPPGKDNVPPETTRAEWRKAELAFGCILFSDESFQVLQDAVDHGVCLIDDEFKCRGRTVLNRPPARVRDLIAQFDPHALRWFASMPLPLSLAQLPPSIDVITEPKSLCRRLDEIWTAANCLQVFLDKWIAWFVELQEKGDAPPGVALDCAEMVHRAIKVLLTRRPSVEPFDGADEAALLAMLPPIPTWWISSDGEADADNVGKIEQPRVRWQEDREFLDRYYRPPEGRHEKAVILLRGTTQLIDLLKSFPMTARTGRRLRRKSAASQSGGESLPGTTYNSGG